ncbi:hypothetical protein QCA50_005647 [Cerrena zonata]|uniref:Uncharacterized protein n=1 Tax=Cerrena zonata TaxID=2478898 RepID=A0AAW0GLN8_9APHY
MATPTLQDADEPSAPSSARVSAASHSHMLIYSPFHRLSICHCPRLVFILRIACIPGHSIPQDLQGTARHRRKSKELSRDLRNMIYVRHFPASRQAIARSSRIQQNNPRLVLVMYFGDESSHQSIPTTLSHDVSLPHSPTIYRVFLNFPDILFNGPDLDRVAFKGHAAQIWQVLLIQIIS